MYTTQTAIEIAKALRSISNSDGGFLVVDNKDDAETLSQVFLDAGKGGGSITGPFYEKINGISKLLWFIGK